LNASAVPEPVDLQEALTSYINVMQAMHSHIITRIVLRTRPGTAITAALFTVPALCREAARLRVMVALARLNQANLAAAARATVAADHDGEPDPLWYLRDELAAHGQLSSVPRRRG
jgi:hypothetical protein